MKRPDTGRVFRMPSQHPAWRDFKVKSFATVSLDTAEIEARVLNVCKAFDKASLGNESIHIESKNT